MLTRSYYSEIPGIPALVQRVGRVLHGVLVRVVLRVERVVHVVVGAVVHCGHHVPDLLRQGIRRLPLEVVLGLVVQEHRQDGDSGADRHFEGARPELVVEPPPLATAFRVEADVLPGVDGVYHGFDDLFARLGVVAIDVERARRLADLSDHEPVAHLDFRERYDVEQRRYAYVLERRRMVGDQDEARRQALAVLLVQPQIDVERAHEAPAPRREEPGDGMGAGPRQPGEEVYKRRVEDEVQPAQELACEVQQQQHVALCQPSRRNPRTAAIWSSAISMGAWPMPSNTRSRARGPRSLISAAVSASRRSDCAPRRSSVGQRIAS